MLNALLTRENLTRENLTYATFGLLAFVVASSKRLLLFNEEILVGVSFLCFLWFSLTYMREAVESTFALRNAAIESDFEQFLAKKERWIFLIAVELVLGHNDRTKERLFETLILQKFHAMAKAQGINVQSNMRLSIADKLDVLEETKDSMTRTVQSKIVGGIRGLVMERIVKDRVTANQLPKQFVRYGITQLKTRKKLS